MTAELAAWRMPGRIEVLGKHTDYGGGRVLVCAVDRGVTVRAERIAGPQGTVEATSDAVPDVLRLRAGESRILPDGHWGRYVQIVLERLSRNFGPLPAARVHVTSDLPLASGMSSSSAVVTGVALALADLAGLPATELWARQIPDRVALAGYAASIENGKRFGELAGRPGVGTSGGSLDHTGMLNSEDGNVSFAEFDPMRVIDRVALPADLALVVAVSGVLAEKSGAAREAYNRGPALLAAITERWKREQGRADTSVHAAVRSLVGADLEQPLAPDDDRLTPLRRLAEAGAERDRLDQFLQESCVLVPRAHAALRDGDLPAFAAAVRTSQRLAETHLGNQVPATVDLVREAEDLGAIAASAFGAGFGGSVWALVPTADAAALAEDWLARYRSRHPAPASSAWVTRPGPSGHRVDPQRI